MKRTHDWLTLGAVLSALVIAAPVGGCGGSKTGGPPGTGGTTQGTGGVTAAGGSGGSVPGTGGLTGTGGGKGGTTGTGGSGGSRTTGSGGSVTGGSKGTGGRVGSGGTSFGSGGLATGGVGGLATGGAGGSDGGTPDAPVGKCSDITTQVECDARSDCHSVFEDPGNCACPALGCCARFRACGDGDQANCTGPALCEVVEPHCEGPYVIAYRGSCYEGCVKQTDCALPACPQAPPANGASCGPLARTCYYEDCSGIGRTVAVCTGRAWQVTTGACASVYCEPNVDSPYALSCQAGKVCVVNRSGGGAPIATPTCLDHSCGTGPITPQCIPSLNGVCTATYSLGGAIVTCQYPFSCGDATCG